jgi:hypothetical protein
MVLRMRDFSEEITEPEPEVEKAGEENANGENAGKVE